MELAVAARTVAPEDDPLSPPSPEWKKTFKKKHLKEFESIVFKIRKINCAKKMNLM